MRARIAIVVAALFCGRGASAAEAGSPGEADAVFADGSVVRVVVLQESLEIQTKYGKLLVPMADIRSADFMARVPADVLRKVEAAIKRLGSESFDQREAAVAELIALEAAAYPALCEAAASPDAEVANRAKAAIEKIKEKVPAAKLSAAREDRIETLKFPVVGQVLTATLKARSENFGEVELKVGQLRGLRMRNAAGEGELTVDAAKFGSKDTVAWFDTGIDVNGKIAITATGEVDMWNDGSHSYVTGPNGGPNVGSFEGHPTGLLLGRIGETGPVFAVGAKFDGPVAQSGRLYLRINPYNYSRLPVGSYKVKVTASR